MTDKVLVRAAEADLDRLLRVIESMVGLPGVDQTATDPATPAQFSQPASAPMALEAAPLGEAERRARQLASVDAPTKQHRHPSGSNAPSVTPPAASGAVTWSGVLPRPRTPRSIDETDRTPAGSADHARASRAPVASVGVAALETAAAAPIVGVASNQSHATPSPVRRPENLHDHPTPTSTNQSREAGSAADAPLRTPGPGSTHGMTPRPRREAPFDRQLLRPVPDVDQPPNSDAVVAWATPTRGSGASAPTSPGPEAAPGGRTMDGSSPENEFVTLDELEERVADIIEIALVDAGIDLP